MELKKAVEVLNKLEFEDYEYTYNGLYHNIDTILIKQAIDTVLEELNNRIPREYIENILEELNEGRYILNENGEITGRSYEYIAIIAIHRLQKLLNKE